MPLPIKKSIKWIQDGNPIDADTLNAPSLDLDENVNRILTYLRSHTSGDFDYDTEKSSGLTFAYRGGKVRLIGSVVTVPEGTRALAANSTAYVEYDPIENRVTHNNTRFTSNGIPLWRVSTNASRIISSVDMRSMNISTRAKDLYFASTETLSSANLQDAVVELDTKKLNRANDTLTGNLNAANHTISFGSWGINGNTTGGLEIKSGTEGIVVTKNEITFNGNKVWHSGNDGKGSGLDADLLDGLDSTDFLGATANAVSASKLATARRINNVLFDGTADITIADNTKVPLTRQIVAGNGLTGGGTLENTVTVRIGTPGTVSGSSSNAVTNESHTHELNLIENDIVSALGYSPSRQEDVTALVIALG